MNELSKSEYSLVGLVLAGMLVFLPSMPLAASPAKLGPCAVEGLPADALCGIFEVPENRETKEGRRLSLHVAVLPATDTDSRRNDPLFALEGGPGAGLSGSAAAHVQLFTGVRRHRDLVLVDQRGTGLSHALQCPPAAQGEPAPAGGLLSPQRARACRVELEKKADLAWYTTAVAMDDLDDIRAWLGYSKINLFGVSYGSRSALVYLRRHPEHVRSVLLMAPYPLENNVALEAARVADDALARTVEDCGRDRLCQAAFPELAIDLQRLAARFKAQPLQIWNDQEVGHDEFVAGLRMMLFFPQLASRVPLVVHSASQGEWGPYVFVRGFLRGTLSRWISLGTFLSILCSEDVSGLDRAEVRRRGAGSFIGPAWSVGLIEACSEWPRGQVPADFSSPVRSDAPMLLLSGGLDPSMSPDWAVDAVKTLSGARTLVVAEGSHNFIGMSRVDCLLGLMTDFVERGTADGLDAACLEDMRRPAFVVP